MIREPFAFGDAFMHRVDPRFRIVIAVLFSVTIAMCHRFHTLLGALMVSAGLILAARLSPRMILKQLLPACGFIAFLWCLLPFSVEGPPVFSIGPLTASLPGVMLAAQISLKSIAVLLALVALISTMHISALGHGLQGLHLPGKFVHLLLLTYRYIFVIEQEYQRLVRAAKIRGFQAKTSLHTYRTYAYLVAMLLVRSSLRAQRVECAMRCRAFTGRFHGLSDFSADLKNWVFATVMTGAISGLLAIEMQYICCV